MEEGERYQHDDRESLRKSGSKYDFVKVNVWLSGDMGDSGHYYVLSRYLTSRMLTVTKIRQMKAVQIALELKKQLVDSDLLDVSQEQLESILFAIMEEKGFGGEYVKRYKMVTNFFRQRRPLIILICGVHCSGKSTIAQALASRLNLPNVLQTDIIHELLQKWGGAGPLHPTPLHKRPDLGDIELVAEFQREARIIRKGVSGDLIKTIRDGKPIIIEGMHLDPGLYLYEFGRHGLGHLHHMLQRNPSTTLQLDVASPPETLSEGGQEPPHFSQAQEAAVREGGGDHDESAPQRSFRHTASFALSFSRRGLHPRITPCAARDIPGEVSTTEAAVAGSPGLQWLQQVEDDGGDKGHSPGPWRASAWLGRQSRRLLGLSPKHRSQTATPLRVAPDDGPSGVAPAAPPVPIEPPPDSPRSGTAEPESPWAHGREMRLPESVFAGAEPPSWSPRATAKGRIGADAGRHASLAFQPSDSHSSEGEEQSMPDPREAWGGAAEAEVGRREPGPVFVPIVLCMEGNDHHMLVQQWCQHQGIGDSPEAVEEIHRRLRLLQQYLASYSACNVPVIRVSLTHITATIDLLHDYLLECIALQMGRE